MTPPKYQAITNAEMGRSDLPGGGYVEVIAGEYNGVKGPATTFSPVHLYNLKPKAGEEVKLNLPAEYATAILAVEGSATLSGEKKLPTDHLAVFANDGEKIVVKADEDSILLVISGEPLNEPIASYGPFLMNTNAQLAEAMDDYRQGKFGYLA
jgi:redox-sensitive bicupin YhaK (pirin superfamily)